jgi:glutathione S-transferase
MGDPVLVLGTKNWSSWSLRPWLACRQGGIPFREEYVPLRQPDTAERARAKSPSGLVPVLKHDGLVVWESLAILEYLAERFPRAHLWPEDSAARAVARSVSAEMHSGFLNVRRNLPMAFTETVTALKPDAKTAAEIARIKDLWADCRNRFGAEGPFLFGAFSAADAMYAPVVSRFLTYGIGAKGAAADYMEAIAALPAWAEWGAAAAAQMSPQPGD